MPRDPNMVMTCKKCVAEGVAEPFRGTFGQLGKHSRQDHPKSSPAGGMGAAPPPAGDIPSDALGGSPADGDYTRTDERVPGGAQVNGDGDTMPTKRRTLRDRIWGDRGTEPREAGILSTKERAPVRGHRSSTADVWELGWKFLGGRLERSNLDVVVGRCMVYQSPVAGEVLEGLTKGTFIDRLVQPLARRKDELETAAALFMLPMLLAMLERSPQMAPVLLPMISDAIEVHLFAMVPIVKKERARKTKRAEALRELYPDAAEGVDPIMLILSEMFAGTVFEQGFTDEAIATAQQQVDDATNENVA